jgi:hypothetical protein
MANNESEKELAEIKRSIENIAQELKTISQQLGSSGTKAENSTKEQAMSPTDNGQGSVKIIECDGCLQIIGTFTGGGLTLTCSSTHNTLTGVKIGGFENMIHDKHGTIFNRNERLNRQQVVFRYDFGDAVKGPRSLVLVGERGPQTRFVYGNADGLQLLPFPIPVALPCSCADSLPHKAVFADKGDGTAAAVGVEFPPDFAASLETLIKSIKETVARERWTPQSINTGAALSCFWGTVACELAAKACILGCAGNPLCMLACLAAEVACLLALDESKQAA